MIAITNHVSYTNGAWFGIGAFTASAAIATYTEMYATAAGCAILAILWYIGIKQATTHTN